MAMRGLIAAEAAGGLVDIEDAAAAAVAMAELDTDAAHRAARGLLQELCAMGTTLGAVLLAAAVPARPEEPFSRRPTYRPDPQQRAGALFVLAGLHLRAGGALNSRIAMGLLEAATRSRGAPAQLAHVELTALQAAAGGQDWPDEGPSSGGRGLATEPSTPRRPDRVHLAQSCALGGQQPGQEQFGG